MFEDYEKYSFESTLRNGHAAYHDVYAWGTGPSLMVMHELSGLEKKTRVLAEKLIGDGFRVHLPHILGPLGRKATAANTVRALCLRKEFSLFSKHQSSPIVDWLGALTAEIQRRDETDQVGVIGMCLTGNFALVLLARDGVAAAVASQPSLSFSAPWADKSAIHMSPEEVADAKAAMASKGKALALRFSDDRISPKPKMEKIVKLFEPHIDTESFAGPHHSLLTYDFRQEAYDLVLSHLRDRMWIS
ncbi:MAG: dienelactone hydrolase family protein [Pseudomonadota bacterium]